MYTQESAATCKNQLVDISHTLLERLKHGYKVDSFEYNMALSNQFMHNHRKFTKKSELATSMVGVRSFWEWLVKLKSTNDRNFLAGIQVPLSEDGNREKAVSVSGKLTLYKSDWRSNIIKFCGWTDQTKRGERSRLADCCS